MNVQKTMKGTSTFGNRAYLGAWALCMSFIALPVLAVAAPPLQSNPPEAAAFDQSPETDVLNATQADLPALTEASPPYEYQLSARPDPFKPFIAPKMVNPSDLVDVERELTGMQLFEPGQLTLVAIMDTPNGRVAMVEDVTKKGYVLKEGILIGRYGEVTEIRRDQVVITETAHTRGGDEIQTVVAMKLKRDGEGQ